MPKGTVNRTPRGKEVVWLTIRVVSPESKFSENFGFMCGLLGDNAPTILSSESNGATHVIQCQFDNAPSHRVGKDKIAGMLARFVKAGRISRAVLSTNEVVID
jgi:hypothetical protein